LHIATFDPTTVLALLDEIERLRREGEVLAEALRHVYTCENCECTLCPQGTELSYRAYRALGEAMDLLDDEKIADNVTRFALYDPDLNAWECQACRFWWEFEDGDPYDHDMRFCPRCGRRTVRGRNKSTVITLKQRERHQTHLQALQGWAPPRTGISPSANQRP